MLILLIIALILAWPTYGLSLVAYLALTAVGAYFRARQKRLITLAMRAMPTLRAGEGHPPSWASSGTQLSAFIGATIDQAIRKGVPKPFIDTHFSVPENKAAFIRTLGVIESQGASIREQGIVATIFICEIWKIQNDKIGAKMREIQELLNIGKARSSVSSLNRIDDYEDLEYYLSGISEDSVKIIKKCHGIAEEICSITGQNVTEVLTLAVSAPEIIHQ